MIVIVKLGKKFKDITIVDVTTTTDPTQARFDAYCSTTGDNNPQETDVLKRTRVPVVYEVSTLRQALRSE